MILYYLSFNSFSDEMRKINIVENTQIMSNLSNLVHIGNPRMFQLYSMSKHFLFPPKLFLLFVQANMPVDWNTLYI